MHSCGHDLREFLDLEQNLVHKHEWIKILSGTQSIKITIQFINISTKLYTTQFELTIKLQWDTQIC